MKKRHKALIIAEKCQCKSACKARKACPLGAILQKRKWLWSWQQPRVESHRCVGCGECVKFCPHQAIVLG